MITFDLTYTFDPTALGGYLEYRKVNSDGTFSPWVTANNSIGNINGYITPLTGTLTGVQGNIGNPPDFLSNTAYQFRMRQVCQDGVTETFSPIDGDYYSFQCADVSIRSWVWDLNGGGYYIPVTIYPFSASTSIVGYKIMIYDDLTQPALATYVLDQVDAIANLPSPYIYILDQNNVPGGIAFATTYYITVNVIITTSTGTEETINCPSKAVRTPTCSMYRIDTGDEWYIEWTDCDGNQLSCGNAIPHPPTVNGIGTPFSICSIGKPNTYFCGGGGVLLPPRFNSSGVVTNGAHATDIGPCDPSQYNYDTSTSPPTLDGQPCLPCI